MPLKFKPLNWNVDRLATKVRAPCPGRLTKLLIASSHRYPFKERFKDSLTHRAFQYNELRGSHRKTADSVEGKRYGSVNEVREQGERIEKVVLKAVPTYNGNHI